jgi:hypothetical protein
MVIETLESSSGVTPYVASVSGSPVEESFIDIFMAVLDAYVRLSESPDIVMDSTVPAFTSAATCESGMDSFFVPPETMSVYALMRMRNMRMVEMRFPRKPGPP